MTEPGKEKIAFDVETSRVLEILSSEIYDSPKAFLRENIQNAYDAILMRCTQEDSPITGRKIEIIIKSSQITVCDDGIGMTEDILKNNFWKAGSSGKKSKLAQRSGVIGTFGIGAMANFGVCTKLRVETRHIESEVTLISSAVRNELKIAQDCVDLERVDKEREPGTTVVADIDPAKPVNENEACEYLEQYVKFLPVPVRVNGRLISQQSFENTLSNRAEGFEKISSVEVSRDGFFGKLCVSANRQNFVFAHITDIKLNEELRSGEAFFVQGGGAIHGFRNWFGLAPAPTSGYYDFGGFINLDILQPTAGREALSQESIQHINKLLRIIEAEVSQIIADTHLADVNQRFQQYILANKRLELAGGVKILVRPAKDTDMIALGSIKNYETNKRKYYYKGRDNTILNRFASEQSNLFQVSQDNPRRSIQLRYLSKIASVERVPDEVMVDRIPKSELNLEEAAFLIWLRSILMDDYLISDVDAEFAKISHDVPFEVRQIDTTLQISIERETPSVRAVIELYTTSREVFDGFMKDFVREHIYPRIRNYVPSSTKQGRDALYEQIRKNKELFRIKESEYGEIESLLAGYIAGKTDISDVIKASRRRVSAQYQYVGRGQIGSVEDVLPKGVQSKDSVPLNELEAAPPIIRDDLKSDMKILTSSTPRQELNNFQMFLAIPDRMLKLEGEFLRWPHTTKLIWGSHRIIYIFTDATGSMSLYYDIELELPLEMGKTGGKMFLTTTIVIKNRIFIPVPRDIESAFRIADEDKDKEFRVRFDTIP